MEIVVTGSLNMDLVAVANELPAPGQTLLGERYFTAFGGKGANQAYAAARLGGRVAMLGRVGADHHGGAMRANLDSVGCDVTGVRTIEGPSGVALIFVASTGQNSIVVVPGANQGLTPEDVTRDVALLNQVRFVLLQLESPLETVIAAAKAGRKRGARVVLDPAPALPTLPNQLIVHVDILTPNESEAAALAGSSATHLRDGETEAVVRKLQEMGLKTVILKLGERGCLIANQEQLLHVPAPHVSAVDTTAAGDVFNAAMVVALAGGSGLEKACRFAVQAAALSVTRYGAQSGMPTRAEVEAFILRPIVGGSADL